MRKVLLLSVLSGTFIAQAHAKIPQVVYGEDNRQEVYDAAEKYQLLAKSTATMIPKENIALDAKGLYQLNQQSLRAYVEAAMNDKMSFQKSSLQTLLESVAAEGDKITFCKDSRFVEQSNAGMCSGFLIAPDLIMTAGHCVTAETPCADNSWVFDYKVDKATQTAGVDVDPENVYKCKQVILSDLDGGAGLDYGIVQLDRKVKGRKPLEIRSSGKVGDTQSLVVIGNPSGLPTKVAAGANVRDNSNSAYFEANLDTFQGNSGSAVFNAETGVVEGILVRGDEDYVPNLKDMCVEVNKCAEDGCAGESSSRLTSIYEVATLADFNKASTTGDIKKLTRLIAKYRWVDFYTKDGQSSLMKAAEAGKLDAVRLLVANDANVNLQDAEGNTPLHHVAMDFSVEKMETIKLLLANHADTAIKNNRSAKWVDTMNREGKSPLMTAASSGNLEMMKLAIDNGANVNLQDAEGNTALHHLAMNFSLKMNPALKLLVKSGADRSITNSLGLRYSKIARGKMLGNFVEKMDHARQNVVDAVAPQVERVKEVGVQIRSAFKK